MVGYLAKHDEGRAQHINGQYSTNDGFVQTGAAEQGRGGAADFPEKQQGEENIINKPVGRSQEDIIGKPPPLQQAAEKNQRKDRKKTI